MKRTKYLKHQAIKLRQKGLSYQAIHAMLAIPPSTLSGWLRSIQLNGYAQKILSDVRKTNIEKIRMNALRANRRIVEKRMNNIFASADEAVGRAHLNIQTYELMLAMMYLCEGSKRIQCVEFANSNVRIMQLYIFLLRNVFSISLHQLVATVHARADQLPEAEINYWSKTTGIPLKNFKKTQIDIRTLGKKTRLGYHGVCVVQIPKTENGRWIQDYSRILIDRLLQRN